MPFIISETFRQKEAPRCRKPSLEPRSYNLPLWITKAIVFAFAVRVNNDELPFQDLAVKIEGSFILRYRVFDIYARTQRSDDLAITAETYGGTFRVYSTKEFPGLSASTELTKVGCF